MTPEQHDIAYTIVWVIISGITIAVLYVMYKDIYIPKWNEKKRERQMQENRKRFDDFVNTESNRFPWRS